MTEEIKGIAKVSGFPIGSVAALRLLPYIQYCLMNEMRLDPAKMNEEDREALRVWKDANSFEGGASGIQVTKEFWDSMNNILWYSYVKSTGQEKRDEKK